MYERGYLTVLSSKTHAEIGTPAGREDVKLAIQERLNGLFEGTDLSVSNVYFTEFVVQ